MTEQPSTPTPDRPEGGEVVPFPRREVEHQDDERGPGVEVERARPAEVYEPDEILPVHVTVTSTPFQTRPILPTWITSAEDRRTAARWAAHRVGHAAAFHAVRVPVYASRLVLRAPVGIARMLGAVGRWVLDADNGDLARQLVASGDAHGHGSVTARRRERIKQRLGVAGATAGAAGIGEAVLAIEYPATQWPLLVAAVGVAGYAGRRRDRPIVESPVAMSGPAPKLTPDVVTRALGSLGIAEINKALAGKGAGITFAAPIRQDGPGWRADIDLPFGVTAVDVIERRDRLASGLRRPLGTVWPEPAEDEHTGRLVLWVGMQDMAKAKAAPWPLARASARSDYFAPLSFGTDPRGRAIEVELFENNILIGALPGAGKTATVRVLLLAAALDPTAELWVFNLKNNDLDCAERVAARYAAGLGDDVAHAALVALRDLKADLERRAAVLSRLPRSVAPDGKVTRELANRRDLGLHPLVAVIDECQNLFLHSEYGTEAGELCEYIIKLGRALGVTLILATQRPDKDSLPKGISANVSIRFCLRVTGQVENDMILGTSAYKNGIRATTLRPSDRGIGYLRGAYDETKVVRSAYIDREDADRIALRARAAREAAGTLSGYAAGDVLDTPDEGTRRDLIADLALVFGADDQAHSDVLCVRLAENWPDVYDGWKPAHLAAALAPHGVKPRQIWAPCVDGKSSNHNGITRDSLPTPD